MPRFPWVLALAALVTLVAPAPLVPAQDATAQPPEGTEVATPGEPGNLILVEAPDGTVHAVLLSFFADETLLYHAAYDPATKTLRDVVKVSRTQHVLAPDARLLSDGSLQLAWWESEGTRTLANALNGHLRPVTMNWDGAAGPIEAINETFARAGPAKLLEDEQGRLVFYTVTSNKVHLYRHEGATWRDHRAPAQDEIAGDKFQADAHVVDGRVVAGWVERSVMPTREFRKGILMTFDGSSWYDRRVLSNFTVGLTLAGDSDDPWVFFLSSPLDGGGDSVLGGKRELYASPISEAGRGFPVNVSRSPNVIEGLTLLATELAGRPAVLYERGSERSGRLLASWGPPFARGEPVVEWAMPEEHIFFPDRVGTLGDQLLVTGGSVNLSQARTGAPDADRAMWVYAVDPPNPLDRADPEVTNVFPVPGGAYREVAEARGGLSDDIGFPSDGVRVWLDGRDITSSTTVGAASFRVALDPLREGPHELKVRLEDYAHNATEFPWTFIVDRTPPRPSSSLSPDVDGWSPEPVTVTLGGTDELSGVGFIRYSLNNLTFPDYTEPFVLSAPKVHRVWFAVFDRAGNRAPVEYLEVRVDTSPPVVDVQLPRFSTGTATLAWLVTDTESGVDTVEWATVEDGEWLDAALVAPEGSVRVDAPIPFARYGVRATNGAGLQGGVVRTVARDTASPTLDVGAIPGSRGTARVDAADDRGNVTVEWRVDEGPWHQIAGPPFVYEHDPGLHPRGERVLSIRASDEAGNVVWHNATFTATRAPVATGRGIAFSSPVAALVAAAAAALAHSKRSGRSKA